jgi:LysR family pca operon transcriptional activator
MRRYLEQRLKLRQLRAVDAIATHRSLLKGARAIGISQPALTKSLQELEEILGVRLFERHARGVTPTRFSDAVAQAARRILAELGRLDEELDRLSSHSSGTVALGALPTAAVGVLPGVLARLTQRFPDIQVRLVQGRTEELLPSLAAGDLDLIVGRLYEPVTPDGFAREVLYEEPISVLARADHPIFDRETVGLEDLASFDLVLPTVSQRVGQEIEHFLSTLSLPPSASLRSSSIGFIREMLHSTDYVTIAPRLMMAGDLLRGSIRVVPLPIATPSRPAGLIYRRDRPLLPNAQTLVDCLRGYLEDISAKR